MHPQNHIDLFLFSLDVADAELQALSAHLSAEESARSSRLLADQDRRRHMAARGKLREILSGYAGMPPAAMRFSFGERGKPYLAADEHIHFNLSHSAHLGAVAVSTDFEIGVDIEQLRDVRPGLPERYFSEHEVNALDALDGDAWRAAFFRCWTRKEAFVKALGEGMHRPLKSFSVSLGETEPARLDWLEGDADAPGHWALLDFTPATGFAGAIAVRTGPAPAPSLRVVAAP